MPLQKPRPALNASGIAVALCSVALTLGAQSIPTSTTKSDTAAGFSRQPDAATARRIAAFAPQFVRTLGVKSGETLVLRGGTTMIPMMEAIAIEARRLGARPWLLLNTDRLSKFDATELPEQFLGTPPTALDSAVVRDADYYVELPDVSSPAVYAGASPERQDKAGASRDAWGAVWKGTDTRHIHLAVPQPSDALGPGLDYQTYERQAWDALTADYDRVTREGQALAKALAHARKVRVTSPEGTDVTFAVNDSAPLILAGGPAPAAGGDAAGGEVQSFPSGLVSVAPVESSANGKIRASTDICQETVRDEAMELRKGIPENVRAASDEACVQRAMKGLRFGFLAIGLNPSIQASDALISTSYYPFASGVVMLGFGGTSPAQQVGWQVPLMRATVVADGKVLVKDGKLQPGR